MARPVLLVLGLMLGLSGTASALPLLADLSDAPTATLDGSPSGETIAAPADEGSSPETLFFSTNCVFSIVASTFFHLCPDDSTRPIVEDANDFLNPYDGLSKTTASHTLPVSPQFDLSVAEQAQRGDHQQLHVSNDSTPNVTPPPEETPSVVPPPGSFSPASMTPAAPQTGLQEIAELTLAAAAALVGLPLILKLISLWAVQRARTRPPTPVMLEVLQRVETSPGIHHKELVRRIGRGNGTVEHAVNVLIAQKKLGRTRLLGRTCYFVHGALPSPVMSAMAALASRAARKVLQAVHRNPGTSLGRLAQLVDATPSTTHYHVHRLRAAGLVTTHRFRGTSSIGLTPLATECLGLHASVRHSSTAMAPEWLPSATEIAPVASR